jgi:hypothetical protein
MAGRYPRFAPVKPGSAVPGWCEVGTAGNAKGMTSSAHGSGAASDSDDDESLPKHADQTSAGDLGEEDAVGEDAMQEDDAPEDS